MLTVTVLAGTTRPTQTQLRVSPRFDLWAGRRSLGRSSLLDRKHRRLKGSTAGNLIARQLKIVPEPFDRPDHDAKCFQDYGRRYFPIRAELPSYANQLAQNKQAAPASGGRFSGFHRAFIDVRKRWVECISPQHVLKEIFASDIPSLPLHARRQQTEGGGSGEGGGERGFQEERIASVSAVSWQPLNGKRLLRSVSAANNGIIIILHNKYTKHLWSPGLWILSAPDEKDSSSVEGSLAVMYQADLHSCGSAPSAHGSTPLWISLLDCCITPQESGSRPTALPHIAVIHRRDLLDPNRK
ncbi:unnamed protein product [Pleuronectes platessa]|uniref:Uncharacterized protein n=1 Tax=Pleuronectes platessa TaxID=8262 RepID=A0A9N7UPI2_PLEPL|nr:unnamed protein product [Pleuronectes platessa]